VRPGMGTGAGANIIAFAWRGDQGERWLAAVNYSQQASQCYLRLPYSDLHKRSFRLEDRMSAQVYLRSGDELAGHGLYIDLPSWGYHVFRIYSND